MHQLLAALPLVDLTLGPDRSDHDDPPVHRNLDLVVGVGISAREGEAVLLVMLDRPGSQVEGTIPDQLEGFRVEAEEIGEVSAF
jgi:hypothetical protein